MKKSVCLFFTLALLAIPLIAQEELGTPPPPQPTNTAEQAPQSQDPRAAMAAAAAAEGIIMPGQVTTPMGKITLHGMFVGGLMAYMQDNTAVAKADGDNTNSEEKWVLMPFDATWQENAAKVSITYENGKYGAYFMFAAEDWDGNVEKNYKTVYFPYAFVWRSFFDSKLKFSLGKLYAEDYQTRDRIWKTEGAMNGGWQFSDSNNNMAFRVEFKPVEGLNVGVQWDMLPMGQSLFASGLPSVMESLKEIGIAAEYKSGLFNAMIGARFDGADGMNKFDFYGYLDDYYGGWGYIGNPVQNAMSDMGGTLAPHFKYKDEVYGKVYGDKSEGYNIGSVFSTANADKPLDVSHRVMFGFNFKGIKNLTAIVDGSFWNLGDFDRFGAGAVSETFKYQITPKFNAGLVMYQQFYGNDVFPDNMINAPYFRFEPVVAYQLTPTIEASLLGTYGICQDVLESEWRIKPTFVFTLGGFGAFRMELFYELKAVTYTKKAVDSARSWNDGANRYVPVNGNLKMLSTEAGKATYNHYIGVSVMWMF
ncbi:MAG: hypothetical protein LBB61_04305 [Treponema sp.]|nr:hypothetical protein [Treponema sp.]